MPDEFPSYTINTIEDLLDVADEHIDEVLESLVVTVQLARETKKCLLAVGECMGNEEPKFKFGPWTHVCDGKKHLSIDIKTIDEEVSDASE